MKTPSTSQSLKNLSLGAHAVFLDVDGCLLDFEKLLIARMALDGIAVPTPEQMAKRQHDYVCEAFPFLIGRDREAYLVGDVFAAGSLKTQESYSFLNKALLSKLMSQPNVLILTKLDPNYVADRQICLKREFGVDLTGKILTVWGKDTKGDRMRQFCEETGHPLADTTLVDDRHDNLETAMRLGASGILVERSYNEPHRERLAAEYGSRYASVAHPQLAERVEVQASIPVPGAKRVNNAA